MVINGVTERACNAVTSSWSMGCSGRIRTKASGCDRCVRQKTGHKGDTESRTGRMQVLKKIVHDGQARIRVFGAGSGRRA
ncbi:hypothetical protein [Bosea sp. 2RAB26]|uniref:hypothetical protein n=1 Tax=Bosea sp. 2RAB26 TaxID=3237476 RepID=UPI003F8E9782